MEEAAKQVMSESQIVEQILSLQHLLLVLGLYSVIGFLKYMRPVREFLFSEKWNWLIAPVCLVLAILAVWVLDLTTFETNGMKAVAVVFISMAVTWTHEAMIKHLLKLFQSVIKKKTGGDANES
jgi:hypothetical protein